MGISQPDEESHHNWWLFFLFSGIPGSGNPGASGNLAEPIDAQRNNRPHTDNCTDNCTDTATDFTDPLLASLERRLCNKALCLNERPLGRLLETFRTVFPTRKIGSWCTDHG